MKKILLLAVIILALGCKKDKASLVKVEYVVNCIECNIIFSDSTEVELKRDSAKNYWSYLFYTKKEREVYVVAKNLSYTEYATATVWINDKIADRRTVKGIYNNATASANTKNY